MAKGLKLENDWIDDKTLRVSWMDVKSNDNNLFLTMVLPLIATAITFYGFYLGMTTGSFGLILLGFVLILGTVGWSRMGALSVKNQVEFSPEYITHNGRKFRTNDVTRFEIGSKTTLTGENRMVDGQNNPMSDPMLIRMWINDTSPHVMSSNNWQIQVNHEIRDTLAKALEAVRNIDKQQDHEEKFGVVDSDTGMPDY